VCPFFFGGAVFHELTIFHGLASGVRVYNGVGKVFRKVYGQIWRHQSVVFAGVGDGGNMVGSLCPWGLLLVVGWIPICAKGTLGTGVGGSWLQVGYLRVAGDSTLRGGDGSTLGSG
jgi:hypothetical protein